MKRADWTVKDHGIRPAGPPDRCLYCDEPKGSQHKPECVIRDRTVVIEMTVELAVTVPESWDTEAIEFHYNESSWCANNIVYVLDRYDNEDGKSEFCLCEFTEFRYVREATEEDETNHGLFVADQPS